MSAPTLSPEAAEQRARELLDSRIASVRDLVTKASIVEDRRSDLADAEAEASNAWRAALRDGWSVDELKSLGLTEPAAKRRRARRGKGTQTVKESAPATSPETPSPSAG